MMVCLWQCYCEARIGSGREGYWGPPLQAPQNKADISAFSTTYTPLLAQLPSSSPKYCVVSDPNRILELSKQGTVARPGLKPQEDVRSLSMPVLSLWY